MVSVVVLCGVPLFLLGVSTFPGCGSEQGGGSAKKPGSAEQSVQTTSTPDESSEASSGSAKHSSTESSSGSKKPRGRPPSQKKDARARRREQPREGSEPSQRPGDRPLAAEVKPESRPEQPQPAQEAPDRTEQSAHVIAAESRLTCQRLGIEGVRREYGIESSDPIQVAREVSRRYDGDLREAVFEACLGGLRAND